MSIDVLASIVGFLSSMVIIHFLACRIFGSRWFMIIGLSIGLIGTLAFALSQSWRSFLTIYVVGTLWLAYLMFFINLINSISLQMLKLIAESPNRGYLYSDLISFFNKSNSLNERLAALLRNGFLESRDGQFLLTPKGKHFLKIVTLGRKILRIDNFG
jgi:hypothetical protein